MSQPELDFENFLEASAHDAYVLLSNISTSIDRLLQALDEEPIEEQLGFVTRHQHQIATLSTRIEQAEALVRDDKPEPRKLLTSLRTCKDVFLPDELDYYFAPRASGEKSPGRLMAENLNQIIRDFIRS